MDPSSETVGLLRFNTCGSVDDGKSTLIGRLLFDANALFDDHLAALEADSKRVGTCRNGLDFSLLLDGLTAEREQGITIDVAYRFFSTPRRKYIVADTPGHEQYTRNTVTGASTAELCVILVDATKGILPQTRRHSVVVSLLGVNELVLVVNKMDLVDYSEEVFRGIEQQYRGFVEKLGKKSVVCIPVCATQGDNIVARSNRTPWYQGPTLMSHLETVELEESKDQQRPFRLCVQWVNRSQASFRGLAGTIASGRIRPGAQVIIQPAGVISHIEQLVTADGKLEEAAAGHALTVVLAEQRDVSRGDLLADLDAPAEVADQFQATLVWMSTSPLLRGRTYTIKLATATATAQVMPVKYKLNVCTLEHVAATKLEQNEIGVCDLELDRKLAFDPYATNRHTGSFILVDRITHETVAAGMISFPLHRAANLHWQPLKITKQVRAEMKGQKPRVLWYTGLSGAGKSTVANLVDQRLCAMGRHTFVLDGDNVRHGLNRDLGFTEQDRVENIRRVAEVAKLMLEAGLMVSVALISPFRAERRMARALFAPGEFVEVFVDVPLEVAEARDPKGLYQKARSGRLHNFTGLDSPYERPEAPELVIETSKVSAEACAEAILRWLGEVE